MNNYTIFEFFYDESFKDYGLIEPVQIAYDELCTAIGYRSLQNNTTGTNNNVYGASSLFSNCFNVK
jgi:hypothetical protein